jgi:parallel beta-helix repeat protein
MRVRAKNILVPLLAAASLLPAALAAKTIPVAAGDSAQERLQEALILAEPGDVVQLGAGVFKLTDGLSLDVPGVTVRGAGAGADGSVLDFSGQMGAGEGLLVTSDDVLLRDFAVINSKGDGIKSKGADRIVYFQLRVEWTAGPKESNGAYGVYPVESTDVLVDSVYVRGASDAGIYVGQSRNIIVRDSIATENVAGIEIENSYNADVTGNIATKNTGGILVFDLPNLPQMGGRNVRVFDNIVSDNMTPNFAPKGNIVASVPTGTGILIMANRSVTVFDNIIADHGTANIMVIGYRYPFEDAKYDPLPRGVITYGNQHGRAGFAPAMDGGKELAAALGGSLPPILWDGSGDRILFGDAVAALTLGLSDPKAGMAAANPQPIPPADAAAIKVQEAMNVLKATGTGDYRLPVKLPESMEAKVR